MARTSDNAIVDSTLAQSGITIGRRALVPLRPICERFAAAKARDDNSLGQAIIDELPALKQWLATYTDTLLNTEYAPEFQTIIWSIDGAVSELEDTLGHIKDQAQWSVLAGMCSVDFEQIGPKVDIIARVLDDAEDVRWDEDWNTTPSEDRKATDPSSPPAQISGRSEDTIQAGYTTSAEIVVAEDEPLSERDAYYDQLMAEMRRPDDSEMVYEEKTGIAEWRVACRFDYLIPVDTFDDLYRDATVLKAGDARATDIATQAVIAAGAPLRRAANGRFAFDGVRWRSDTVLAVFSAWWEEVYERIRTQQCRPMWFRSVSYPLKKQPDVGAVVFEHEHHMERHEGGRPSLFEWRHAREEKDELNRMTRVYGGPLLLHGFLYEGLPLADPVRDVFARWKRAPHKAMEAVFKVLPEEETVLIEDPVEHLSTPHGLLRFNRDGMIDRYTDNGTARRLGITRVTAPLPEIPADADLADLDWRLHAPSYAEALDMALPEHVADYFQRLLGYTALGWAHEKLVILVWGEPDTLKSTLLTPIVEAMGLYGTTVRADRLLKAGSVRDTLADLRGMRMVMVPIRQTLTMGDAERLELLSGGVPLSDGWISQAVVWGEVRTLPRLIDTKPLERRLRVIRFNHQLAPDEIDKGKIVYIREHELPGVLLFILQGVQQYLLRGLDDVPPDVMMSTMVALLAADLVPGFVRLLTRSETWVPFSDLYDLFARLCGLLSRPVPAKRVLSAELKAQGFAVEPKHAGKLMVKASYGGLADFAIMSAKGDKARHLGGESWARQLPAPEAHE